MSLTTKSEFDDEDVGMLAKKFKRFLTRRNDGDGKKIASREKKRYF